MRLKKIPKGAKCIKFENFTTNPCVVHWRKKPFTFLQPMTFMFMEPQGMFYDLFELVPEEFPEMQFYCKYKIGVSYVF